MQLSCDLSVLLLHGYNIFVLPLTNIDHIVRRTIHTLVL